MNELDQLMNEIVESIVEAVVVVPVVDNTELANRMYREGFATIRAYQGAANQTDDAEELVRDELSKPS